jgi:hypothetical protein
MASDNTYGDIGIALAITLFVIFSMLKLTGYIGWSWCWVVAPLWMPLGFILILAAVFFLISMATKEQGHGKQ